MDFAAATSGMVAVPAAAARKRGRTAEMGWTVDSASSGRDVASGDVLQGSRNRLVRIKDWKIMWIQTILTKRQRNSMILLRDFYKNHQSTHHPHGPGLRINLSWGLSVVTMYIPKKILQTSLQCWFRKSGHTPCPNNNSFGWSVFDHIFKHAWFLWKKHIMKFHVSMPAYTKPI